MTIVELLTSIANAIREKTGKTNKINAQNLAFEIKGIEPPLDTIELQQAGIYDVKDYKFAKVSPSDLEAEYINVLEGDAYEVHIPEGTTRLRSQAIGVSSPQEVNIFMPTSVLSTSGTPFYAGTYDSYLKWNLHYAGSFSEFIEKNFRLTPTNGYSLYIDNKLITEITDITDFPAQSNADSLTRGALGNLIVDRVFIPNGSSFPQGVLANIMATEIIFEGTINGELGLASLYNSKAKKIILPTNITKLEHLCLGGLNLAELVIPEGVTEIGSKSFSGSAIEKLILPSTLTKIGKTDGVVTYELRDKAIIVINAVTPPTASISSIFSYTPKNIYIPAGTLTAYQNATNWSTYSSVFVEMNEVALNVQTELLNNEEYQYSLDGGLTWSVFDSETISLAEVALVKFKNANETSKLLIGKTAGAYDIGSITDAELTYATEGSMTIYLRLE